MKAITFKNILDRDFVGRWDGVDYLFKPGQAMMVEDWKAFHFAKHAANEYLNERKIPTDDPSKGAIMQRFLGSDSVEAPDPSSLQTKILNAKVEVTDQLPETPVVEKKKLGRPKKDVAQF